MSSVTSESITDFKEISSSGDIELINGTTKQGENWTWSPSFNKQSDNLNPVANSMNLTLGTNDIGSNNTMTKEKVSGMSQ